MSLTWQDETGRKRKPIADAPLFEDSSVFHAGQAQGGGFHPLAESKENTLPLLDRPQERGIGHPEQASGLSSNALGTAQCETGAHEVKPFAPDKAHARRNDPETSHAAAKSVSLTNLGRTKEMILAILREAGPLTDEGIIEAFHRRTYPSITASDSGIRTRRSWLVDHGFVEQAGFSTTAAGRSCQVWRIRKDK